MRHKVYNSTLLYLFQAKRSVLAHWTSSSNRSSPLHRYPRFGQVQAHTIGRRRACHQFAFAAAATDTRRGARCRRRRRHSFRLRILNHVRSDRLRAEHSESTNKTMKSRDGNVYK